MLKPLQEWYCDVCGEIVDSDKDAWAIWDSSTIGDHKNFRIVHNITCSQVSFDSDLPIQSFLGTDGLAYLTSFLAMGPAHTNNGKGTRNRIKDFEGFVDFFRRCQLPGYEEARRGMNDPEILEDLAGSTESSPYLQESLKNIARRSKK